jgi:hypothetical protein
MKSKKKLTKEEKLNQLTGWAKDSKDEAYNKISEYQTLDNKLKLMKICDENVLLIQTTKNRIEIVKKEILEYIDDVYDENKNIAKIIKNDYLTCLL